MLLRHQIVYHLALPHQLYFHDSFIDLGDDVFSENIMQLRIPCLPYSLVLYLVNFIARHANIFVYISEQRDILRTFRVPQHY